jgi:hypothetical protein
VRVRPQTARWRRRGPEHLLPASGPTTATGM